MEVPNFNKTHAHAWSEWETVNSCLRQRKCECGKIEESSYHDYRREEHYECSNPFCSGGMDGPYDGSNAACHICNGSGGKKTVVYVCSKCRAHRSW